jgi:hypothetical protein
MPDITLVRIFLQKSPPKSIAIRIQNWHINVSEPPQSYLIIDMDAVLNNRRPRIEANTTDRLLSNLKLAIDEAKLVRMIVCASDQVRKLETTDNRSKRISFLTREISYLEEQLETVRGLAEN